MDIEVALEGLPRQERAGCLMTYSVFDDLIPYYHCRAIFHKDDFIRDWSERIKRTAQRVERSSPLRKALCDKTIYYATIRSALDAIFPELQRQCILTEDETTSAIQTQAALMSHNEKLLRADLDRTADIVLFVLRLLCEGPVAQRRCALAGCEQPIVDLMNLCTIISARGYDGSPGPEHEKPWQDVIGAYKKLLLCCLLFMKNFIFLNAPNKLSLWLDLFGHSNLSPVEDVPTCGSDTWADHWRTFQRALSDLRRSDYTTELPRSLVQWCYLDLDLIKALDALGYEGRVFLGLPDFEHFAATFATKEKSVTATDPKGPSFRAPVRVIDLVSHAFSIYSKFAIRRMKAHFDYPKGARAFGVQVKAQYPSIGSSNQSAVHYRIPDAADPPGRIGEKHSNSRDDSSVDTAALAGWEYRQTVKKAIEERLDRARQELRDRMVSSYPEESQEEEDDELDAVSDIASAGSVASDDTMEEEEEYRVLRQKSQITDVPIVLSPSEIEPLCLILQTATHHSPGLEGTEDERKSAWSSDMTTNAMNTMILVSRASGRNLLREMLIYVAAWDLQEHEFYFKSLVSVMRSILACGLMPYLYGSFREEKDIVSPTQAILIKVLAQTFKQKQLPPKFMIGADGAEVRDPGEVLPPTLADRIFVDYVFEEFRERIIPETCALIFLQGQVRENEASPEDFPLNLWDMERVYEGIYQFLEFFAVLSEFRYWKQKLVDWEIISELIALLRELERSIVKSHLGTDSVKDIDFKQFLPENWEAELAEEGMRGRASQFKVMDVPEEIRGRRRENFLEKYNADKEAASKERQARFATAPQSEKVEESLRNERTEKQIRALEEDFLQLAIDQAEHNELYDLPAPLDDSRAMSESGRVSTPNTRSPEPFNTLYGAQWQAEQALTAAREAAVEKAKKEEITAVSADKDGIGRPMDTTDPSNEPSIDPAAGTRTYNPDLFDSLGRLRHKASDQERNPDPSLFEWRNLKKLVILCIASLSWKSRRVQSQVLQHGGLELILKCCNFDIHNPYLREHAIMCLRFLLENSPENQSTLEALDKNQILPEEILRSQAYVTFIDEEGKVGLRRKAAYMPHDLQVKLDRAIQRVNEANKSYVESLDDPDSGPEDEDGEAPTIDSWQRWEQYTDEHGSTKLRKKPNRDRAQELRTKMAHEDLEAEKRMYMRMEAEENEPDSEEPVHVDTLRYTLQQHGVEFEPVRF